MKTKKLISIKIIITLLLLWTLTVTGQSFDPAALAMTGNYSAISRGVSAMTWNPANLALERNKSLEFNFLSISGQIYNNSFSISDYNRYFTEEGHHGVWSDGDKHDMLDLIPGDGLKLTTDIAINLLGVAYKNYGFSVQLVNQAGITTIKDKTPFDIVLFGPNLTRDYQYHDNIIESGEAYSALKMSFGYAYSLESDDYLPFLEDMAIGVNLNYFLGLHVAQNIESEVGLRRIPGEDDESAEYVINIENRYANVEFSSFPGGHGLSFDLGATAKYEDDWRFSLSLINLFGFIRWTTDVETQKLIVADSALSWDVITSEESDNKIDYDTTYASEAFVTSLPITLRLGASYNLLDNLTLTADYAQALNTSFGNRYRPRIGVGAQYYPIPWLPLRGGLSLGGKEGFMFGIGTGLTFENFDFDLSYAMNNGMWPTHSEGMFTALGFKFKF
ncbi:MAG: hypothetical protein JXR46_02620 [Calditrichaceae bacterium]|nr:hypothetical protein [Calditrichaceae bacterium]